MERLVRATNARTIPAYNGRVYALVLLCLSLAIFFVLLQVHVLLALAFLIAALLCIPAAVLHRREAAHAIEVGPDSQSYGRGLLRLAGLLGLDFTGVAIGALLFLLSILLLHVTGGHH
jgi:hypothetical protein